MFFENSWKKSSDSFRAPTIGRQINGHHQVCFLHFGENPQQFPKDIFEKNLQKVNEYIRKQSHTKNREKLVPFSGPQCAEDRFDTNRLKYGRKISFGKDKGENIVKPFVSSKMKKMLKETLKD